MTGLLGGQIQVLFDPVVSSLPHIQGDRLRPLAEAARPHYQRLAAFSLAAERG